MLKSKNIQPREIAVYRTLTKAPGWPSTAQIAESSGCDQTTALRHLRKLVANGVVDLRAVGHAHHFRLAVAPNPAYVARLHDAAEVLA